MTSGLGTTAVASFVVLGLSGCSGLLSNIGAGPDLKVGDCLKVSGPVDRPEATKADCGSTVSNFKVAAVVAKSNQCPTDVDSYYSQSSTFTPESTTVCLDIDWLVGGCMSVDPENDRDPYRVDCADSGAANRQRATQVLAGVASVDQCASGLGYAYDERQFTVCVENVA
ncbi:LppU family putative lipoprotein [Mycolicibacterium komossense]|uniref:LppU family putative lipoprotein n=1 Tax=Mycolicibacterium komossense TaxID=1779 RepID=UPI003F496188